MSNGSGAADRGDQADGTPPSVRDQRATLRLDRVSKSFAGAAALRDVSVEVRRGEVLALLGENGAGKSTLIKVASGVVAPDGGEVWIGDARLRRASPRAARALGVRVIHQERQIAGDLSVGENVLLDRLPGRLGFTTRHEIERTAGAHLRRLGIYIDPSARAGELTVAAHQLVELARAVADDARLVIMDEPTASLHRQEIRSLFEIIRGLRRRDVAVLYISHHLEEVFEVADRVTVLRDGVVAGERTVTQTSPEDLISLIFGAAVRVDRTNVRGAAPAGPVDTDVAAAEMRDVHYRAVVSGITLSVAPGEILAITGNQGSGASEVAQLLAGVLRPSRGQIHHAGRRLASRHDHTRHGVAFLPSDRKRAGLLLDRSITDNLLLSRLAQRGFPLLNGSRDQQRAARIAGEAGVRFSDLRAPVRTLSGGNQQKTILGRWLGISCRLLVFDEPTAGVDIASKVDLYGRLLALAAQGATVVFVSSDYEEISAVADRVLVMREGRIVEEIAGDDANGSRLLQAEMGAA
jgi:ribose transport system ATP-binding protein